MGCFKKQISPSKFCQEKYIVETVHDEHLNDGLLNGLAMKKILYEVENHFARCVH